MIEVRYTRNLFLRGMCIVYLFAFLSFYIQIPGLYGENGVLPARTQLDLNGKGSFWQKFNQKPTFLWFAPLLGLNVEYMLHVIALLGTVISFLGFISQRYCISAVFLLLWSLYYSMYQVGQIFMQYQWDTLLLEAGFLCVFIAPYFVPAKGRLGSPSDGLTLWGIRWLLFRYLFSSGAVKLASGCPVWWNLDALSHHFETECLPAPLGWYAHHLPTWFLQFNTVLTNVFELAVPVLFLLPIRRLRIVAFYLEMFLQFHIFTTGNWNFRDFLVICMCISLLDDRFFYRKKSKTNNFRFKDYLTILITLVSYGAVIFGTVVFYKIKFLENWTISTEIGFTQKQFDHYLHWTILISLYLGLISLGLIVADAVTHSILSTKGKMKTIITTLSTLISTVAICCIFILSAVPFTMIHPNNNVTIPVQLKYIYNKVGHLRIVNKHGLFDRMTGVNGRPEIIIEGSNDITGPWKEYEFLYKPGNVNNSLPFVAPHSPRLDWQMWFAARGTYHQNPWIMSLTYRLLSGQPEVVQLLNHIEKPFGDSPPKFIKASLYHYHFVPWRKNNSHGWWTRERVGEYFPIFSHEHPPLLDYLTKMRVLPDKSVVKVTNETLKMILHTIHALLSKVETSLLLWSFFTAGCALIMTTGISVPSKK